MATCTITITDRPGGITVAAETDPMIELVDGVPDEENMTDAQCATVAALVYLRTALGSPEWP